MLGELYFAGDQGEQSVIGAFFNALAREKFGPALADDNHPAFYGLAVVYFDAQPFGDRISSELCGTTCFFMRHNGLN